MGIKNVIILGEYKGNPTVFVLDVDNAEEVTPENFSELVTNNESSLFLCDSDADAKLLAQGIAQENVELQGTITLLKDDQLKNVFHFVRTDKTRLEVRDYISMPSGYKPRSTEEQKELSNFFNRVRNLNMQMAVPIDTVKSMTVNVHFPWDKAPTKHLDTESKERYGTQVINLDDDGE